MPFPRVSVCRGEGPERRQRGAGPRHLVETEKVALGRLPFLGAQKHPRGADFCWFPSGRWSQGARARGGGVPRTAREGLFLCLRVSLSLALSTGLEVRRHVLRRSHVQK